MSPVHSTTAMQHPVFARAPPAATAASAARVPRISAAMTTMTLEQSPNPDGGVGRVSRAATSDATSEGQI